MSEHEAGGTRERASIPESRLVGWFALVGILAALAYASQAGSDTPREDDLLYRWDTAAFAVVMYAIILAVVVALSRGIDRDLLGLRRPPSWPRALGTVGVAFVAFSIAAVALNYVLEAGEEQGLVPDEWDSGRAAPFVANFLVVAAVAPLVEELTYRGVGMAVTRDKWGVWPAVAVTSAAFGLAHGLLVALPILTLFGLVLAVVRERTKSLYPPMLLHAIFNAMALLFAVIQDAAS